MLEIIAAVADNGVIGVDNKLPWHIKADMQHFRELTINKPVIMGRRTFNSIGKPLPKRINIVMSQGGDYITAARYAFNDDIYVFEDIRQAQLFARLDTTVAVAGGATIYRQLLPYTSRLHLTRVHLSPEGDTYFPNFEDRFELVSSEPHSENGIDFDFEMWIRVQK